MEYQFSKSAVYVGTYGKYNDGSIEGKWLCLSDYSDKADFYKACHELHRDESDPEFMFQDWEYIPDKMIGECFISGYWWDIYHACEGDEDKITLLVDYLENYICSFNLKGRDIRQLLEEAEDHSYCKVEEWDDYVHDRANNYMAQFPGFDSNLFDFDKYKDSLEYDVVWGSYYCFSPY